ncbi:MAG TPA: arginine--tRNA ligase [Terriglobales bacterium]|nr:arginine--tRNA ligase [Terriglobales bacterium]
MKLQLEQALAAALAEHLTRTYAVPLPAPVLEDPPKIEMGEFATPVCFELAKRLRRPPRQLAQEIAGAITLPQGFARAEAAGGGYLNFFVDRSPMRAKGPEKATRLPGKVIVEHTNINPNKAAHIGHLRNAVLGDTWVRLLRNGGREVEVQNLQDNTGVQVADVVAAFLHLPDAPPVEAALADPMRRFDYLCWDLYAAIAHHYESHPEDRDAWRAEALHAIEAGGNPIAELAERISNAIALCHLRTMQRLGIEYDVLPRESEILQLHLWEHAFRLLQERKAVRLEDEGKNQGCWVMDGVGATNAEGEEEAKVLVRSNGTVTYVAKDIAYQLWKFGLLPLEFGYAPFHRYPDGHVAWATAMRSAPDAPEFGKGEWVYNVIDVRQSYLQEVVVAGLLALGFEQQAGRSIHFSYEMVALSAACAAELGYAAAGDEKRVDVSGRKGTGVKADDLLDRLQERTLEEVAARHPEWPEAARRAAADAIAVGALRYFLLKFTRTTLIAFDFKEALSFEGETGPYVQYAAVRAANILAKAGGAPAAAPPTDDAAWALFWLAERLDSVAAQAVAAREPAMLAKYAFQLAQAFNNFYHHQPVLQEPDAAKRAALLALVEAVHRQLARALELMGISVPAAM